jgi:hypothetical protein
VHRHLHDKALYLSGNARTPTWTGFQTPEEAKEISVPPPERIGTHDCQQLALSDKLRQEDECDPRCVVRAARSDLAFDVTGKLLPEEEVLRRQLRSRPDHQPQHARQVSEKGERCSEHLWR